MNRRSKTILISGGITLLATLIISFICIDNWSGLTGWAFATMLWSEVVFFGGLVFVEWISKKSEQIMTRALLNAIIAAYAVINFLISVLYMTLLKEANTSFAVVQVAILAVAAVSMVISLAVSKGVQRANEHTMTAVENVEAMIARLNKLALCPECECFASTLKKMSDDLRFTDISKVVAEDADISDVISTIEVELGSMDEFTHEKIKEALLRLNTLILQRKISVSAVHKGRI